MALRLTLGVVSVPLKVTVCGLLGAMSVKFSKALRFPPAEGVNVTLTEHVPLGIIVAPVQGSLLLAKSLELVPLIATVRMARLPGPLFVTVTLCAVLAVSRAWGGNVTLGEDKLTLVGTKLATRFEALTVPIPVAKSQPVAAPNAGWYASLVLTAMAAHAPPVPPPPLRVQWGMVV